MEHFTPQQITHFATNAWLFLAPGARLRIAVPDGYFLPSDYALYVRAGSTPSGHGQDHMVVWTVDTLPGLFRAQGFTIQMQEWCDAKGHFHAAWPPWAPEHGLVRRSLRHDDRNKATNAYQDYQRHRNAVKPGISKQAYLNTTGLTFPSLIFDAIKPIDCPVWQPRV